MSARPGKSFAISRAIVNHLKKSLSADTAIALSARCPTEVITATIVPSVSIRATWMSASQEIEPAPVAAQWSL